jgi:PKD repeat protein
MKKNAFLMLTMVAVLSALVISCKKSTPAPTAEIFFTIGTDGYTVTFNPTVTDVDTYAWDFGDGQTSTEANPTHTYAVSGDKNVVLVVKGGGGEATAQKTVSIAASFLEMLTGGATAVNGKTWVLSPIVTPGPTGDGGGPITPEMTIDQPAVDNILAMPGIDLGAEYDNEYTFFANGNYSMNPKNGNVLAGAVYGVAEGTIQGDPAYDIGMCAASFTPPVSATWTEHPETESLTVDAITDPNTSDIPPLHANVTFTGKKWISLSDGAYFGILDFPTTTKFIIKEISATKLKVALFLCGYGYDPDYMMLPTNLIQITFIPKSAK